MPVVQGCRRDETAYHERYFPDTYLPLATQPVNIAVAVYMYTGGQTENFYIRSYNDTGFMLVGAFFFFTFLTGRDNPLCSWVSGHVSKVGIYRGEIRSSYRRPHSRIPVMKSAPPGHLQTCPSTFLPPICPTTSICIGPILLITTNQTYSVYVPGANTFSDFSYSIGWAATPAP